MEAGGEYPPDRTEAVLAAIAYCVKILAVAKGVPVKSLDQVLGCTEVIRPKKYIPPTAEEEADQLRNDQRAAFAGAALQFGIKVDFD